MSILLQLTIALSVSVVLAQRTVNTLNNCNPVIKCTSCTGFTKTTSFRTIDGTCNNLKRRTMGAANTPLSRLLAADYVDQRKLDTPRGFPRTLPVVPTPHEVSAAVFRVQIENKEKASKALSAMFMSLGQFIDHDMGSTPHPSCSVSAGCGSSSAFRYPCFPIRFQHNGANCSSFARSIPVCQSGSRRTRQQINVLSSYLDLSQVYSNSFKKAQSLRTLDGRGELKVTRSGLLPIARPASDTSCDNAAGCSLVGDERGDENIVLSAMHTIWVRNHNFIARRLRIVRRSGRKAWTEDLLFETARKINIAIYQRIVYKEFLPELVGLSGYAGYKSHVDTSLLNVFSTAAFRFGHSLVPNAWSQLNKNFDQQFPDISLQASFFNTTSLRQRGIEPTAFGLLANQSQVVDTKFAFGIARRLFVPVGEIRHEDLTALNIQRGRDHGLRTYGAWRRVCGLKHLKGFSDLRHSMPLPVINGFKRLYKSPNDIDIFAAGMAEHHSGRKMLGPTFQCILRKQFERLRDGDRFFYDARGVFTTAQRAQIRRMTFSEVLCNTLRGIVSIQRKSLKAATSSTVRVICSRIPGMNFGSWDL